ncbi:hypothetical protein [Aquaspirillum sp. LM1]|uniref:hypothetical protein n=1 Tax=Aquaspirillum sp. LM1 TaxID=1938604 RepID=UPI0015C57294|nr:hypothetical protein [Aquaspirillum sp. LM1]
MNTLLLAGAGSSGVLWAREITAGTLVDVTISDDCNKPAPDVGAVSVRKWMKNA